VRTSAIAAGVLGLVAIAAAASRAQAAARPSSAVPTKGVWGGVLGSGAPIKVPAAYAQDVDDASAAYAISGDILARLLYTESRFNPQAYNASSGAIGIAQFLPGTADQMGVDPNDATSSIWGAARYLDYLYTKFNSWYYAVAAYNWGEGNVAKLLEQGYVVLKNGVQLTTLPAETLAYAAGITGQA
jgi:soluble lytic murein transglycosylase-like protein